MMLVGRVAGRGAFKAAALIGAFAIIRRGLVVERGCPHCGCGRKSSGHQNRYQQIAFTAIGEEGRRFAATYRRVET
jgi:hypothetical protein